MGRVLVVDDEQGLRDVLGVLIQAKGHHVVTATGVEEARRAITGDDFDLVVTDLRLGPKEDGLDVVRHARSAREPAPEVIVMTAYGTRETALAAQKEGALFYAEKGPHLASDLGVLVDQAISQRKLKLENQDLRRALVRRYSLAGTVGKSDAMREIFSLVEKIAPTRANVLITGESGTGKERIAKAIHYTSGVPGPFVPLNAGAIPEHLIESELFGHVKGAFTGAEVSRRGVFEAASGGTIFLDEIAELPVALQPKLLRVLQERRIRPVGADLELEINARVIAATNRDLEVEVKAGRFREDLFFRLNVFQIDVPPLRERREDIPLLIQTFLDKYNEAFGRKVTSVSPPALERLLEFGYPGNVRQLENLIERGVALAGDGELGLAQLPRDVVSYAPAVEPRRIVPVAASDPFPEGGLDLERTVEEFERRLIDQALERAGGVKTRAAELLGLSFRQFRYKLSKYGKERST